MKHILLSIFFVSVVAVNIVVAKTPDTHTEVFRPSTSVSVAHPETKIGVERPTTSGETFHPTTQTTVFRARTEVQVAHPITQVAAFQPQTTVSVIRPHTEVEVFHPQTTVEVFHPQTPGEVGGQSVSYTRTMTRWQNGGNQKSVSSQITTSMNDFKPMQAKDFSSKPSADKAFEMGKGSMELGNTTNAAEKDNANKSSLLGEQKKTQDLEVDPKQTKLGGLSKLLIDREKVKEKK